MSNTQRTTEKAIAELLRYSLFDTHFDYNQLTQDEKEIVGGHIGMERIIEWIVERINE